MGETSKVLLLASRKNKTKNYVSLMHCFLIFFNSQCRISIELAVVGDFM